jgi:hypothetical protein
MVRGVVLSCAVNDQREIHFDSCDPLGAEYLQLSLAVFSH